MRLTILFLLISFFSFGQATFHSLLTDQNASVLISTDVAEPVDGAFEVSIVFQVAVTGLTEADFNLTSCSMENLSTLDNINYTANILPDGTGDVVIFLPANTVAPINRISNTLTVTVDEDFVFLTNPATSNVYYEFRELVGDNSAAVLATDPGLRDLSGNARHAVETGSATMTHLLVAADVAQDKMAMRNISGGGLMSTGETGATYLNQDFSVQFEVRTGDGQQASAWFTFGNTSTGPVVGLRVSFSTAGLMIIRYQGCTWTSTSAEMPNGATGLIHFDFHFDFTNDTVTVYKNGSEIAGSITGTAIASVDPTAYACTRNLYVGGHNNDGTAGLPATATQMTYFAITKLQNTTRRASVRAYLQARKATFEVVDILNGTATTLLFPHDAIESRFHAGRVYVSGKGADSAVDQPGTFDILDCSDPTNMVRLGGYYNAADQLDGETVFELSADRVLHFYAAGVHLFNVSNPASPTIVKTVTYSGQSVNGAVLAGNRYVIGANKGGYLQVFDFGANLSDIDNFILTGEYDTTVDLAGDGPHDIDICADGEHVVLCSRGDDDPADYDFAIYKVMNAGSLISMGSWTYASRLQDALLFKSNRSRVMLGLFAGKEIAVLSGDPNFSVIDITNKAAPVIDDTFDMTTFSSGLHQFRQRWTFPTWQVGVRLMNVTDPTNVIQDAGYYNSTTFTTGNASFHDVALIEVSGVSYLIVAAQSSSQVVAFRINRFSTL